MSKACKLENGIGAHTHPDFKAAFDQVREGADRLDMRSNNGVRACPMSMGIKRIAEMFSALQSCFTMYQGPDHGAARRSSCMALTTERYIPLPAKMVPSCDWTGHDEPDRAALRHRSGHECGKSRAAGRCSYNINGSRRSFILGRRFNDMGRQQSSILVAGARSPGGPEGIKGVSIFNRSKSSL